MCRFNKHGDNLQTHTVHILSINKNNRPGTIQKLNIHLEIFTDNQKLTDKELKMSQFMSRKRPKLKINIILFSKPSGVLCCEC